MFLNSNVGGRHTCGRSRPDEDELDDATLDDDTAKPSEHCKCATGLLFDVIVGVTDVSPSSTLGLEPKSPAALTVFADEPNDDDADASERFEYEGRAGLGVVCTFTLLRKLESASPDSTFFLLTCSKDEKEGVSTSSSLALHSSWVSGWEELTVSWVSPSSLSLLTLAAVPESAPNE